MPALNCSVCANPWTDESGVRCAMVKVQTEHYELNVSLTRGEAEELRGNPPGVRTSRGSLRLGRCAGSTVFWCVEGESLTLLIGPDEEVWSVAFVLPPPALAQIRQALQGLSPWLAGLSLPQGYLGHVPEDYAQVAEG
jgi:hypothetical protein